MLHNNAETLIDALSELVTALGSPSFPSKLLQQLNQLAELNHLSLVHMEAKDRVTYVFSASDEQVLITETMQQLYLSIYYRLDPNKEFLNHMDEEQKILLRRLRPEEIEDLDYRRLWYEKMRIVDRLSILFEADKGLYCLNLFRTQKPFDENALQAFEQLSPLLSALSIKQARLSGSLSGFMTRDAQISTLIERLEFIKDNLTEREKEVCARILLGLSSEGIALDLGIKSHSVHTYRKRAYAKLNITSQNELFSLCLTLG